MPANILAECGLEGRPNGDGGVEFECVCGSDAELVGVGDGRFFHYCPECAPGAGMPHSADEFRRDFGKGNRDAVKASGTGTRSDLYTPPISVAVPAARSSSSSSPKGNDGDENHVPRITPVDLGHLPEPGPRKWIWEGRIPDRAPTVLYGDSGLAKSYVAQLIANHVVRGAPLYGGTVLRGKVLYVDFELDVDEQTRRAYAVARGLGLDSPPPGIYYLQPDQPLPRIIDQLKGFVESEGVVLAIVDSFGLAAAGDPTAARDVIPVLTGINSLPCASLVIDHCRNPQLGETAGDLSPFGSVYKRHLSRSVLQVVKTGGDDASLSVLIRSTKANFAALAPPLALRVVFADDSVAFEQVDAAAAVSAALAHSLSALDRVLRALTARDDASPQELAETTGLNVGTVRNKLTRLRQQGTATPISRGRWKALKPSSSPSPTLGDDDDDAPARGQ